MNHVVVNNYIYDKKFLEVLEELQNFVLLKNSFFKQILLEKIFETVVVKSSGSNSENRRSPNADILNPILLLDQVKIAFSTVNKSGSNEPEFLDQFSFYNENYSELSFGGLLE